VVSPRLIARYLRRKVARLIYLARGVEEDTQKLYGPNPNEISPEERTGRMRMPKPSG
jgi:hypothetical protein